MSKNIAVLFGGVSPEHEVSVQSASFVMGAIGHQHHVIPVYITRQGQWLLYDGKPANAGRIDWDKFGTPAVLSPDRVSRGLLRMVGDKFKVIPVDVVFPVLHGAHGEDGTVQGLCELAGIPYVGCGVLASSLCMDKTMTNMVAASLRLPQVPYVVVKQHEATDPAVLKRIGYKLGYPCFVKPAAAGSSVGISKVANRKELIAALELAFSHGPKVLVEKAANQVREIEVAILGNGPTARASVPGEVVPDGEFYDYTAKYHNPASQTIVPAILPEETAALVQQRALALYHAVDGRGLARVDFFVTPNGDVLFNEINTLPGFTAVSLYTRLWKHMGLSDTDLIDALLETVSSL